MSVLDVALPQLGRIRAGDKQPVKDKPDVMRPARLERFRLTSSNPVLLKKAVELGYGEAVEEWTDAPEGRQWQLYCTVDSLPVAVPHIAAFSQYSELWQGAECVYRCDGQVVVKCVPDVVAEKDDIAEGMPCPCDQFAERPPTVTRVNLYLPDLPGIGVWRLDTRGFYSGSELQGIVMMLQEAALRGMWIDASLRITHRTRRVNKQTRHFPVIQLQPQNMTMRQIMELRHTATALPATPDALPSPKQTFDELRNDLCGDPYDELDAMRGDQVEMLRTLIMQLCAIHGLSPGQRNSWIWEHYGYETLGCVLDPTILHAIKEHVETYRETAFPVVAAREPGEEG